MIDGPMAAALAPLRARLPHVVQEQEILRVAATLAGEDPASEVREARRAILAWSQNRAGGRLPREAWDGKRFEYLAGGRTVLAEFISGEGYEIWAIRTDDPDKTVPGRIWTHDVAIGWKIGESPRISIRQSVNTTEPNLQVEPHVPGCLLQLADRGNLVVVRTPILPQPLSVANRDDVDVLIGLLESPERRLPVLVASGDERSSDPTNPLIDTVALARATVGLAHVVAVPAQFTYALSDAFGKARSTYHGAVRLYLPGFDSTANPYEHKLILADAIARDPTHEAIGLRRMVAELSLRRERLGRDVIAFAAVRSAALRADQALGSMKGSSEPQQVTIFQRRIEALESELTEAKGQADQSFALATAEEERAKLAESQLASLRARIAHIEKVLADRGLQPDDEIKMPSAWGEFADWCDQSFAGRCVLASAARRGIRKPEFADVLLAAKCVQWLATICWDRRVNGGGRLANISIDDGIENAPCGDDTFAFDFQGRRLAADWHIKNGGNTRDRNRCLRIYYGFDETTLQIVIADMPAHRRTGAT